MFVTWKPDEESEARTFDFDPDDVTRKEGEAIEKAMGGQMPSFEMWLAAVQAGNMKARTILLWHLLKQEHRGMQLNDVPDFRRRQLKVEMSARELIQLRDKIGKTKMDDATREAFQAQFDADIAEAMEREGGVVSGEVVPKLP